MSGARSYITFRLGDELFAVDVQQVREVLDLAPITRIPSAPDYVRGVVNVRGSAIPVVDLRLKFGLPRAEDTLRTRILVLELEFEGEGTVIGGLADSVHDVVEIPASELRDPPRVAMRWRSELVSGMARIGESFAIVLDIVRVFSTDLPALLGDDVALAATVAEVSGQP